MCQSNVSHQSLVQASVHVLSYRTAPGLATCGVENLMVVWITGRVLHSLVGEKRFFDQHANYPALKVRQNAELMAFYILRYLCYIYRWYLNSSTRTGPLAVEWHYTLPTGTHLVASHIPMLILTVNVSCIEAFKITW